MLLNDHFLLKNGVAGQRGPSAADDEGRENIWGLIDAFVTLTVVTVAEGRHL